MKFEYIKTLKDCLNLNVPFGYKHYNVSNITHQKYTPTCQDME